MQVAPYSTATVGEIPADSQRQHPRGRKRTRPTPCSQVKRVLTAAVADIRGRELELFSDDPNSMIGLRLATVRLELRRAAMGLPVRVDTILHALTFELKEASPNG